MGVVIVGTGVFRPTVKPWTHGARRLADGAARRALRQADRAAGDVDLLVNTGVYRERGLGEPALAALIQEDVDANAGDLAADHHGTFSFDIDNGACGVLTGIDVLRGFLASGAITLGMIVTSDSGPGPLRARALPYPEAGAALLVARDDDVAGFSGVRLTTYPEHAGLMEGYWEWRDHKVPVPSRVSSGNHLVVRQRAGFIERATRCAAESVSDFLAGAGVTAAEVDLLIATPEPGFADTLADEVGIPHGRTLHAGEQIGRTHTAQPIAAIDLARRTGRWSQARTILLVSAGSGITVACALYRH